MLKNNIYFVIEFLMFCVVFFVFFKDVYWGWVGICVMYDEVRIIKVCVYVCVNYLYKYLNNIW